MHRMFTLNVITVKDTLLRNILRVLALASETLTPIILSLSEALLGVLL